MATVATTATGGFSGAPKEWLQGLERLKTMARPAAVSPNRWHQLVEDATAFMDTWAVQAGKLGWGTGETWGVHPTRPVERFDGAGLVWMLLGREIVLLDAERAAIRTPSGKRLSYHRRPNDTLRPGERVLVWALQADLRRLHSLFGQPSDDRTRP